VIYFVVGYWLVLDNR